MAVVSYLSADKLADGAPDFKHVCQSSLSSYQLYACANKTFGKQIGQQTLSCRLAEYLSYDNW